MKKILLLLSSLLLLIGSCDQYKFVSNTLVHPEEIIYYGEFNEYVYVMVYIKENNSELKLGSIEFYERDSMLLYTLYPSENDTYQVQTFRYDEIPSNSGINQLNEDQLDDLNKAFIYLRAEKATKQAKGPII